MTFLRKEMCNGCKRKIEVYEIEIIGGPQKGKTMEWKKGCVCEDIELAKKAKEHYNEMKLRKMQEIFNRNSLISKDLEKATFENYLPKNKSQEYAKKVSMRYVEIFDLEKPRNLSFHGSFGLGKSHLAKSIADGVMEKGFTAIFISVPKLLRKIKSTFSNKSDVNADEILTMLEKVNLLILDDLGAENHTDWVAETVFDIIDSRQGKHTIYTTNYSPDDLIEKLGERNFSRVFNQDTTILEVEGENHRLQKFKGGGE